MFENISLKFHRHTLLNCLLYFVLRGFGVSIHLISFKFIVVQNILEFNFRQLT